MGEVIYFNENERKMAKYLDTLVDRSEIDNIEVASIVIIDNEMNRRSLGEFLGKSSNDMFKDKNEGFLDIAKGLVGECEGVDFIFETILPTDKRLVFHRSCGAINIDLATELGLGVARGDGEYLLYYPSFNEPSDATKEMLMLKVYFQLMNPKKIDEKLKENFEKCSELIELMMIANHDLHMSQLEDIFNGTA